MQRKNDLLMPFKSTVRNIFCKKMFTGSRNNLRVTQSRSGFAMIMAVIVMIVVATIMMFTLNQTTQTAKRTTDMYLHEQTELHAKSAIEYALFRIAENDPTTACLNNLSFQLPPPPAVRIYDINITMRYVFNPAIAGCDNYISTIITPEQNGSVLMDVVISVDANNTGSEPIRYFRRTIQKL